MKVLIMNVAEKPWNFGVFGKTHTGLSEEQLKRNKAVCGVKEFVDIGEAIHYIVSNYATQRLSLNLYSEPAWDAKIVIEDGETLHG